MINRDVYIAIQRKLAEKGRSTEGAKHSPSTWTLILGKQLGKICKSSKEGNLLEWTDAILQLTCLCHDALQNIYESSTAVNNLQVQLKRKIKNG